MFLTFQDLKLLAHVKSYVSPQKLVFQELDMKN